MQRPNTVTLASIDGADTMSISLASNDAVSFDPDQAGAEFALPAVREALSFLEKLRDLNSPES